MVQVDVFWAYGIGASLGMASGLQQRQLARPLESRYSVWTLLLLALVWAPTGMLLLLQHTSWETMQAAENLGALPAWLVLVTQGLLGYWVGVKLIKAGKYHWANLNWMAGYFGMFFILVYGWDGLGFDRFFYDRDAVPGSPAWTAGTGATIATLLPSILHFFTTPVFITLNLCGVFLIPAMTVLMLVWAKEGFVQAGIFDPRKHAPIKLVVAYCSGVFGALLAAIVCAVVVNYVGAGFGVGNHVQRSLGLLPAATPMHVLSYLIGLPLGLLLMWAVGLRPGGMVSRLMSPLLLEGLHGAPSTRGAQ